MSNLFVRKATGMVRSWSVFDAFIYAFFSINIVTLGFYSFSQMYFFGGGMINALVVSAVFLIFEVIVYASLIAVMVAMRKAISEAWPSFKAASSSVTAISTAGWPKTGPPEMGASSRRAEISFFR